MTRDARAPDADTVPEPPVTSFASDNFAGVDPAVMDALHEANTASAIAYGEDPWTGRLEERFRDLFDAPVETLLCWGGTGANIVGLASGLSPWQAILTVESAHIVVDECGAPTAFTGAPMLTVAPVDGKLTPDAVRPHLDWLDVVHHPQPRVLSISQATESGTLYTRDELGRLADLAHAHGLVLHLDGARIANALAAQGEVDATPLRDVGVDVLTFGFTKIGAMYGEAVVFLDSDLAESAPYLRKRAGQLPSKARFVAAQGLALLDDDRWLRNADNANRMARRLWAAIHDLVETEQGPSDFGEANPVPIDIGPVPEANALFPVLDPDLASVLTAWSRFWPWEPTENRWRWMTSFATTEADVDAFVTGIRHHLRRAG